VGQYGAEPIDKEQNILKTVQEGIQCPQLPPSYYTTFRRESFAPSSDYSVKLWLINISKSMPMKQSIKNVNFYPHRPNMATNKCLIK
jgi:hypothetical protein